MGTRKRAAWLPAAAVAILAGLAAMAPAQLPLGAGAATAQDPQPETRAAVARIVFSADGGIHTIAADGSDRRRITSRGRRTSDSDPSWSPDGSTFAFNRHDFEDESLAIWLADRDGGGTRQLTPRGSISVEQAGPTWSPDGSRLAFTTHDYDEKRDRVTSSLVTIRLDGTDRRVVHSETSSRLLLFSDPAWSPVDDRILFTRTVLFADAPDSLQVVSAAGAAARRLASNGEQGAWSPGGDRIAYSAMHHRGSGRLCAEFCAGSGEIHVANADGSGRVRLTTSRASDRSPSWSGDGLRIAFHSDRNSTEAESEDAPPELYSMRADGSCLTWLTNGTAHSETPEFERGAALSSDPGGCGAVSREPLVETGMPPERARAFSSWWLGRVAPNGLLLTQVGGDPHSLGFVYGDCGRFEARECGDFVNVGNEDLCRTGGLRTAGRRGTTLSLARGALLQQTEDVFGESGRSVLFTHRTRVLMDTASGFAVDRKLVAGLRRFPSEQPAADRLPSTRLPASVWRGLRAVKGLSRREAARRRAVRRRLAQLGVKRRLGCPG